MSHEIRTPLNSVLGFADLILQTPLDDLQREYLDTIQRSGDALLILLNDILDFSKIESGRLEVEAAATDLQRCLDDVVDLYLPTTHARDVGLVADLAPDVPRYLRTDPARLRQILINLVGNAVKFTPTGCVTIHVTIVPTADDPVVRFEVTDTGIGISEEKIRHLFQPFSQADTSTTRRFGGTGLGLVISERLALLLDGDIGIAGSSAEGTTFFLEIPLIVPTAEEVAALFPPPTALPEKRAASRPPLKILVVDDNPINRRLTTQLLKLLGDASDAVSSAAECFAAIETTDYDAILMDVQMPDLDGLEATRMIRDRERSRNLAAIPVVALTAGAMSDDRAACFAAGMDFYLTKPIRRGALDETLRKISDRP
jgi:CheY-like chemotaxis protein